MITSENKKVYLIISIINTILCAGLLIASAGILMGSFMMNDSGKFSENFQLFMIALCVAFPFIIIITVILYWIFFIKSSSKWWLIFTLIPWVYCIGLFLSIYLSFEFVK